MWTETKTLGEFAKFLVGQRLGLNENEQKFLDLTREYGVRVNMTEEGKKDKGFQELVSLLAELYQKGSIPRFEVVEVK